MKLLVIQVAALGSEFLKENDPEMKMNGLQFRPLSPVFPALTCTAQATFRTGNYPAQHGIVGNGFYSREFHKPYFWEQSSSLLQGERIWKSLRENGGRVGQLFWQQSLGRDSDLILSPAPIHKHNGGMIQDCYSKPANLYHELVNSIGNKFNLIHYWGPFVSRKSSEWITKATCTVLRKKTSPNLLVTYLPHLDYELQKTGPDSSNSKHAYVHVKELLEFLIAEASECGYNVLIWGDYAISSVNNVIQPNQILLKEKYLMVRKIQGKLYPDFHSSRAFAIVDHQIAHIICDKDKTALELKEVFNNHRGVSQVLGDSEKKDMHFDHERAGDLILIAEQQSWFAYPWWDQASQAPDYAKHVDIHNKPGYDPCELFTGFLPIWVSLDPQKVKGSHGIVNHNTNTVFATNLPLESHPESLMQLSKEIRKSLEKK